MRNAGFASEAFERVLHVAAHENDPAKVASALGTLHKIVSLDVLLENDLARVVEVTRERLECTDAPTVWQAAVDVAVATGDPALRSLLAGVALGAIHPVFAERENLQLWVRSAAQRALGARSSAVNAGV